MDLPAGMRLPRGEVLKALGGGEGSIAIPRAGNQAVVQVLFSLPAFGFGIYALRDGGEHAWVAWPFFAAGAVVLVIAARNWAARNIPVVLAPDGLLDRRLAPQPIAWSRISDCRLAQGSGRAGLVTTGIMFLVAPSGPGSPRPMTIDCLTVGCAPDELLQAVELMRRRWGGATPGR